MAHLVESLRLAGTLLRPFLVETPEKIADQLGLDFETDMAFDKLTFGQFPEGLTVIEKGDPLFPRLDVEEESAKIHDEMAPAGDDAIEWNPEEVALTTSKKGEVEFKQFDGVELKVAEVIACAKVENADKLLKFRLDAADEGGDRQILSGVAEFYPNPEELIGKKVIIVANLKPRKMRGEISQGMILSAEDDNGKLALLEAPAGMPNGSIVG